MKTDELIRALAADERSGPGLGTSLAMAVLAGGAGAAALFALILAPRPGLAGLLADPRVLLKFAVALSLAVASAALAVRMVRPAAARTAAAWALLVPAALLAAGVAGELMTTPGSSWRGRLFGHYALYCVSLIPLISAPVLAAVLLALRRGAPDSPTLAGAAAGLLAGGVGAALYALHCIDDSPFFVLAWYGAAVALVTAAGAFIGRRVLAW